MSVQARTAGMWSEALIADLCMETRRVKDKSGSDGCKTKRTFASSLLSSFSLLSSNQSVTLFYLHQEPADIRVHTSAPLSSLPRWSPWTLPSPSPLIAWGGFAGWGLTASLSGVFAAVWVQLSGCDKESRKTERFHTNHGGIMKALVKGRRKVRLSLV